MPKNKFQEVIFTIMMVLVMVYAMICYNIALATGGLTNAIFAAAFRELLFMAPLAFLLDFFLVSKIAFKKAYRIVNVKLTIRSTLYLRFLQSPLSACVS